jgi:hypothetical protein
VGVHRAAAGSPSTPRECGGREGQAARCWREALTFPLEPRRPQELYHPHSPAPGSELIDTPHTHTSPSFKSLTGLKLTEIRC